MNRFASHLLSAAAGALITAVCASYWLPAMTAPTPPTVASSRPSGTTVPAATVSTSAETGDSEQLIQQQQQTIASLEQEVAWLQSVLEKLDSGTLQSSSPDNNTLDNNRRRGNDLPPPTRGVWFDDSSLQAIGMDAQAIAALKQQVEAEELEKLQLRNQATREGWNHTSKLFKQLRALDRQFRDSLTPDDYDKVLFATGRNNRVEITDTLENSPSNLAGIQKGDRILSYGGKRIFDPSTLVRSTTEGSLGEMVPVVLQRGDDRLTVYVPRGSLGMRIKPVRGSPNPH